MFFKRKIEKPMMENTFAKPEGSMSVKCSDCKHLILLEDAQKVHWDHSEVYFCPEHHKPYDIVEVYATEECTKHDCRKQHICPYRRYHFSHRFYVNVPAHTEMVTAAGKPIGPKKTY